MSYSSILPRNSFLAAAAAAALGLMALPPAASAGVPGSEQFGLGGGGGNVVHGHSCADIPCNTGDTCSCITGSGTLKFHSLSGTKTFYGTYTIEVSADNSTQSNNGSGGYCFNAGGYMVISVGTSGADTLTLPFSGPGCRINGGATETPLGISAPVFISAGTGRYVNATGTGTVAATFNPTSGSMIVNVSGYGTFQ